MPQLKDNGRDSPESEEIEIFKTVLGSKWIKIKKSRESVTSGCSSENSSKRQSFSDDMSNADNPDEIASDSGELNTDMNFQYTREISKEEERNFQHSENGKISPEQDSEEDNKDIWNNTPQPSTRYNCTQGQRETGHSEAVTSCLQLLSESHQKTQNTIQIQVINVNIFERNQDISQESYNASLPQFNGDLSRAKEQESTDSSNVKSAIVEGDESEGAWGQESSDNYEKEDSLEGINLMNLCEQYDRENKVNEPTDQQVSQQSAYVFKDVKYAAMERAFGVGLIPRQHVKPVMYQNRDLLDLGNNIKPWSFIEAPTLNLHDVNNYMKCRSLYHRLSIYFEKDKPYALVWCETCNFTRSIWSREELEHIIALNIFTIFRRPV